MTKPHSLQPAIRIVMMPRDANALGTIFGGIILSSIDLAGVVEAHQHSDRKLVTAVMHEVKFIAPVFVGDVVSFYTELVKIGNTSITVRVTVEARRAKAPHHNVSVTQAEVVYVAIDDAGNPVPVRSADGCLDSKRPGRALLLKKARGGPSTGAMSDGCPRAMKCSVRHRRN